MPSTEDHELRRELVAELHARPAPRFRPPTTVHYLAFKELGIPTQRDAAADLAHGDRVGVAVDVEIHGEFVAYRAVATGDADRLFDGTRSPFPHEWQLAAPGRRIVAVTVEVQTLPATQADIVELCSRHLDDDTMLISWVQQEKVAVASDFQLDDDGWMRFLVLARDDVGPGRTGRVTRRLLEIETYRTLSMLGFSVVGDLTPRLDRLERRLLDLVARIDDPGHAAEDTLHELLAVNTDLEGLASNQDSRFAATHAYESLVWDRHAALDETRFAGRQTMGEFLVLRYQPAMRTVAALEQRLQRMVERAGRAGDLLRARVDVARSAHNQLLLASLDRRSEIQLRLQHAVEGLSVAAVSYYVVGLLGYLLAPVAHESGVDKAYLEAGLVPIVVLAVWFGLRRVRHRIGHG